MPGLEPRTAWLMTAFPLKAWGIELDWDLLYTINYSLSDANIISGDYRMLRSSRP
jgi:hypothetical protein